MKLNNYHLPALSALLLLSATTGASAGPAPVSVSLQTAELNLNLTGSATQPRWSYPFAIVPQGAIAQPRPVAQRGRVQATAWSPLSVRPGSTNFVMPAETPQPELTPLVSVLPQEQAQSTISISRRAGIGQIRRLKKHVHPETSAPALVKVSAAKSVAEKPAVVRAVAARPAEVKSVATAAPLRIASRPLVDIPGAPEMPADQTPPPALKTAPTVPAKTVATPTPLGSRHKDLLLLAQLEADLNRTDRRLDAAEAKISEGQRQLSKAGNTLRQAMLEAGPDARGLHPFVRVAQRYAGTPYVWGGESARGFDCSGFIIRVMRDLGYQSLPHSAAEQFNYGKPIAFELIKPGDIVFFKNTYKPGISHVGIYLGKGRFIHAAGTGKGTIVSSLYDAKWRPGGPHYAGIRRLITARG